jgi:anti-anti-sigma regulatory factor
MKIVLSDEQSLRNVEDLRQQLLDAIAPGDRVEIDLAAVTEADLAFVQLMASARRYALGLGAEISLTAPSPPAVVDVLNRAGFGPAQMSFWHQGAVHP